jgi:hypothetical protein
MQWLIFTLGRSFRILSSLALSLALYLALSLRLFTLLSFSSSSSLHLSTSTNSYFDTMNPSLETVIRDIKFLISLLLVILILGLEILHQIIGTVALHFNHGLRTRQRKSIQ